MTTNDYFALSPKSLFPSKQDKLQDITPHIDFGNGNPISKIGNLAALQVKLPKICQDIFESLGSHQLEATYQRCLEVDLVEAGLEVEMEVNVPMYYKTVRVGTRRVDIVVQTIDGKRAVLELKAVSNGLSSAHLKQLEFYMEHLKCDIGYLINFPHDKDFPAVDQSDGSVFCQEVVSGRVQVLSDVAVRDKHADEMVQIVKVRRVAATALEAIKFHHHTEASRPKFGVTKNGTPCKICTKQNDFCRLHKSQAS